MVRYLDHKKRQDQILDLIVQVYTKEGRPVSSEYLKDKRISYVVVCPVVDKLDDNDERYINALQGKKTPFEEQLEREKIAKQD